MTNTKKSKSKRMRMDRTLTEPCTHKNCHYLGAQGSDLCYCAHGKFLHKVGGRHQCIAVVSSPTPGEPMIPCSCLAFVLSMDPKDSER